MPVNVIKGIDEGVLLGSIYSYITNTLQLKVAGAHKKLERLNQISLISNI